MSLFKKQGRNITLTSEGKLLFNEALRIIEHLDSTIEQFQSHGLTKIKVSTLAMMRVTYPTCYYHLSKRFIYKMIHMSSLIYSITIINSVLNGDIDIRFAKLYQKYVKHKNNFTYATFIRRALSFICAFRRSNYDGDTPTINSV